LFRKQQLPCGILWCAELLQAVCPAASSAASAEHCQSRCIIHQVTWRKAPCSVLLLPRFLLACSPHAPHQALRRFEPGLLQDHCVKHPGGDKVQQLLTAPDWGKAASAADKQRVEAMTKSERDKLTKAGRRPAADGLLQSVLGKIEHVRFCMHFSEDR
jgi:hypothetical protein